MSLTLPSAPTRANTDATTDSPKQALLTDLYAVIGTVGDILSNAGNLTTKQYGNGLTLEPQGTATADKLHVAVATVVKSATYTALATDRGKLLDCTGTWTLDLTAAATLGDNWYLYVKNTGSGIITLDPSTSETIDNVTTLTLIADQSCLIVCNGTEFYTIGKTTSGGGISGETTYNTNTTLSLSTDNAKIIRCTVASVVYTFPAATGNEGKYWWIANATATDTGVRLVADGAESIGGATGATIYVPAYTTIGFVSDGANWIVFSRTPSFREFNANGTWYCPPGVYEIEVEGSGGGAGGFASSSGVGGGGGGSGARCKGKKIAVTPGTSYAVTIGPGGASSTNGSSTSLGALLTLAGGAAPIVAGRGGTAGNEGVDGSTTGDAQGGSGGLGGAGGHGEDGKPAKANTGGGGGGSADGWAGGAGGSGFLRVRA